MVFDSNTFMFALIFPNPQHEIVFWFSGSILYHLLCYLSRSILVYDCRCLCGHCLTVSTHYLINYIVLVVIEVDFFNAGCRSKWSVFKSVPNDDPRPIGKFLFLLEKNSSSSNKECARNNPMPNPPNPKLPEKNESSSNELNPLLPILEEEFFFPFGLPKNPEKKSSSKGFYSKKCLKISSASWKLNRCPLKAEPCWGFGV